MCSADKCRSYDKSWSCPPSAGELDELARRCRLYRHGVLVQTIGTREDTFDIEAMLDTEERHAESFRTMAARMPVLQPDTWPMGTGACRLCDSCNYPDAPCRFPDKVFPSMEACGLLVSQVCTDDGMKYYYGPEKISYTSCFLFDRAESDKE